MMYKQQPSQLALNFNCNRQWLKGRFKQGNRKRFPSSTRFMPVLHLCSGIPNVFLDWADIPQSTHHTADTYSSSTPKPSLNDFVSLTLFLLFALHLCFQTGVCVCMCACVRAAACACGVRACVRACVRVCVKTWEQLNTNISTGRYAFITTGPNPCVCGEWAFILSVTLVLKADSCPDEAACFQSGCCLWTSHSCS